MDYDETSFEEFKNWLNNNSIYLNNLEKEVYKIIEKAFLEGFSLGRSQRNRDNWELWNQK